MGKDKKNEDEQSREELAEQVTQAAEAETAMMRIEIHVAVNGHHAKDKVTVEQDHPFYGGLVEQKLATVIG